MKQASSQQYERMKTRKHKCRVAVKKIKRRGPRDWEVRGANARPIILRAARRVFARYPFKAASTRVIAQQARIEHPLIHYYFGSKEKLFEAVVREIYEEYNQANRSWLDGLVKMMPPEGFSLYLDRLVAYTLKNPEALQIIFVNMAQLGGREQIPGFHYIQKHMDQVRAAVEKKIPIRGSKKEYKMFIHCFHNLVIALLGARNAQALVLNLDPEGPEYHKWVKTALFKLFLPWLEKLIFPDKG